jgi:hypothetical protein
MKVFISHKREDSYAATRIYTILKSLNVDAYLDLLDGDLSLDGQALTQHIKKRLNECTDLLVVMSNKTRLSWWVPFEVGMAAQEDFPTVTFLQTGIELPEYLEYWPRLRRYEELEKYVDVKKENDRNVLLERAMGRRTPPSASTRGFYTELKARLR